MNILRRKSDCNTPKPSSVFKRKRFGRFAGIAILVVIGILLMPSSAAEALVAGRGFMWTVWSSAPVKLVVCWENPSAAEPLPGETNQATGAERREWVRLALKNSWEREARIIFVGWEQCQNEGSPATPPYTFGPRRPGTADENIKIFIKSTGGSQNPAHGSWGDYMQSGLTLNLHTSRNNIEHLAIHEFGHALGFYHGEERSDWPSNIPACPRQEWSPTYPWWPIPTELLWGAPDIESVMAYCSGWSIELSPTDVAGVTRAYGRHLPGTLLSLPGSLCLSSHANAPNGDASFGWACDEANDDQEWHYDASKLALYVQWPADPLDTRRCLDVDTNTKSKVQIWDCHYGSNQQWKFKSTLIRGYGRLCLTHPLNRSGLVTMETCTGIARQLWLVDQGDVTGRVQLRSAYDGLCLTNDGGAGSNAVMKPCDLFDIFLPMTVKSSSIAQASFSFLPASPMSIFDDDNWVRDFQLGAGGSIRIPSRVNSLCLDVQDVWDSSFTTGNGGPAPGQRVQFFDCYDTQINQKWSFSGHLVSGNKCLALSGDTVNNGALAVVANCSAAAPQQNWDFDW